MAIFGFALMAFVAAVIQNELLTLALIVWGLIAYCWFLLRRFWGIGHNSRRAHNGRHY